MAYSCVRVSFEIGHQSSIRNKSTPEGFTHDWEVFVRGAENTNISHYVEKVVFRLHETFSEPRRVIKEPPYSVKESGYAGFNLPIDIYFKGHDKPKKLNFNYDLHLQPSGPPIKRVTTEKYIFKNPSEELRRKLIRGGGVEVSQGSNNFSDLFGPPIKKVSPDSKKPASSPKVPPSPKNKVDKLSSSDRPSEKVKYSKHHHKEKDKDKEKDDGDRNTSSSRDKERSKDKDKKEKSTKRLSSPPKPRPISPKRASSPKRPLTPPIRRAPSPKHSPSKRPQTPTKHVSKQEKEEPKRLSDENKFRESKEVKSDKEKKKKERRSKDEKSSREKHKEKDHEKIPKIEKKEIKEEKKIKEKEPPKEEKPKEKEKPSSSEKDKSRHKHKKKRHEEEKKEKHEKEKTKKEVKSDKDKNGLHHETSMKPPLVPSPIRPPPQPEIEKQNRNPLKKLYEEMSDPSSSDSNQSNSLDEIIDIQPIKPIKAKVEEVVEKVVVRKADSSERNNNTTKVKKEKLSSKKKEKKEISKKESSNKEEKDSRKRKRKATTKLKEEVDEKETKIIKLEIEEPKPEPKTCSKSVQYEPTPMETGSEDEGEIASHDDSVEEESVEENKQEISQTPPVAANNKPNVHPEYLTQLKDLQHKIMTLDDSEELQRLVSVITETGQYEVTNATFDFDLCALDESTVKRLQDFFAAS